MVPAPSEIAAEWVDILSKTIDIIIETGAQMHPVSTVGLILGIGVLIHFLVVQFHTEGDH